MAGIRGSDVSAAVGFPPALANPVGATGVQSAFRTSTTDAWASGQEFLSSHGGEEAVVGAAAAPGHGRQLGRGPARGGTALGSAAATGESIGSPEDACALLSKEPVGVATVHYVKQFRMVSASAVGATSIRGEHPASIELLSPAARPLPSSVGVPAGDANDTPGNPGCSCGRDALSPLGRKPVSSDKHVYVDCVRAQVGDFAVIRQKIVEFPDSTPRCFIATPNAGFAGTGVAVRESRRTSRRTSDRVVACCGTLNESRPVEGGIRSVESAEVQASLWSGNFPRLGSSGALARRSDAGIGIALRGGPPRPIYVRESDRVGRPLVEGQPRQATGWRGAPGRGHASQQRGGTEGRTRRGEPPAGGRTERTGSETALDMLHSIGGVQRVGSGATEVPRLYMSAASEELTAGIACFGHPAGSGHACRFAGKSHARFGRRQLNGSGRESVSSGSARGSRTFGALGDRSRQRNFGRVRSGSNDNPRRGTRTCGMPPAGGVVGRTHGPRRVGDSIAGGGLRPGQRPSPS